MHMPHHLRIHRPGERTVELWLTWGRRFWHKPLSLAGPVAQVAAAPRHIPLSLTERLHHKSCKCLDLHVNEHSTPIKVAVCAGYTEVSGLLQLGMPGRKRSDHEDMIDFVHDLLCQIRVDETVLEDGLGPAVDRSAHEGQMSAVAIDYMWALSLSVVHNGGERADWPGLSLINGAAAWMTHRRVLHWLLADGRDLLCLHLLSTGSGGLDSLVAATALFDENCTACHA